jgi:hypothetical protein
MIRPFRFRKTPDGSMALSLCLRGLMHAAALCGVAGTLAAIPGFAQITIDTKTGAVTNGNVTVAGTVDRRYAQIEPTHVELSKLPLDAKTRQEVIRVMQSEQGFAMRPFPRGHKGLTLNANGKLDPAGEGYLNMVTAEGISAKPGERVVLTDVKIEHSRILFDINGGPDHKHRFLRHVEIGAGPMMNPVVQGDDPEPTGARVSLAFKGEVPQLTGADIKALLSPLISFDVKTPIQAFTDTLPPRLKAAILDHHVLVGMSTDMVLFAMGQPDSKSREMDGQMPFEEWIYGKPPKDVEFVRINGNRVIRLEVAKMGEPPVIFTKDEVEGLMRTDGTPLEADNKTRTVKMGDVERDPDKEAPAAPPSLRKPGEQLPTDQDKDHDNGRVGVMRPVQFPKSSSQDESGAQDGSQQPASASKDGSQQKPAGPPAPAQNGAAAQPSGSQPSAPGNTQTPPADGSQPAPAKPQSQGSQSQPD